MIRTKFKCMQVSRDEHGESAALRVVMLPTEENKSISEDTPGGEVQLRISKDAPAYGEIVPGNEYFVDFTLAPKTEVKVPELVIDPDNPE